MIKIIGFFIEILVFFCILLYTTLNITTVMTCVSNFGIINYE